MKNQAVLITGALTKIGRATAVAFAREGARITPNNQLTTLGAKHSRDPQLKIGNLLIHNHINASVPEVFRALHLIPSPLHQPSFLSNYKEIFSWRSHLRVRLF
jgi:hypothetical protein